MWFLISGFIAFLLCYLSDLNTVFFHTGIGKYGFTLGTAMLIITSLLLVISCGVKTDLFSLMMWLLSMLMLGLEVYTLFFSLPAEAYSGTEGMMVCDTGMYALCRHPGVLWFAGFYICSVLAMRNGLYTLFAVMVIMLDIGYVILQDRVIFPRQFIDYGDYCRTVPFLLPNRNSIVRMMNTFGRGHKRGTGSQAE